VFGFGCLGMVLVKRSKVVGWEELMFVTLEYVVSSGSKEDI